MYMLHQRIVYTDARRRLHTSVTHTTSVSVSTGWRMNAVVAYAVHIPTRICVRHLLKHRHSRRRQSPLPMRRRSIVRTCILCMHIASHTRFAHIAPHQPDRTENRPTTCALALKDTHTQSLTYVHVCNTCMCVCSLPLRAHVCVNQPVTASARMQHRNEQKDECTVVQVLCLFS